MAARRARPPSGPGRVYGSRMSTIMLKTSFFPLAFILNFFKAQFSINGSTPAKFGWTTAPIPVQPGTYTIEVFFPYLMMSKAGKASTTVTLAPGQTVNVAYRAPWLIFLPGKITVS